MTPLNPLTPPHAAVSPPPAQSELRQPHYPSRLIVNLYLVLGIGTLILASRPEVDTLRRYLLGIGIEIALALAALLFMRVERLKISKTARLRPADRQHMLLALATVPGLWATGVALNLLSSLVLGYTTRIPPAQFPRNAIEALAFTITTVVVASICEEVMFRGYVQRAYERRSITVGIVVGGLIFAAYHLRFQGLLALVPVSLALGMIAWRTASLYPCIVLHAAYNAIATILLLAMSFLSSQVAGALTVAIACLGVLFTPFSYAALWRLWRTTAPVTPPDTQLSQEHQRTPRWAWGVPLVGLLLVYGYAATTEVLIHTSPQLLFDAPITLNPPTAWEASTSLHYSVQDRLGQEVGEATCMQTTDEATFTLQCRASHRGFDITNELPEALRSIPDAAFNRLPFDLPALRKALVAEPKTWELHVAWSLEQLDLVAMEASEIITDGLAVQLQYPEQDAGLRITPDGAEPLTLIVPDGIVLMPHEWAFRLSGLPFELPYGGSVTVIAVDAKGQAQIHDAYLDVAGGEPTWTPAGTRITWRVVVSWEDAEGQAQQLTGWYEDQPPHTLVRYDDGAVSYILAAIDRDSSRE